MGNEHSKNKEITKNGKIPEKHENGSVNGLSANITSNGLEIAVNGETIVHQNGEPLSLSLSTESTDPDFVIVDSDCRLAKAEVISETPEPEPLKETIKKNKEEKVHLFGKMFKKKSEPPADDKSEKTMSNEDEMNVSPAAADPQLELNSSGEEAAIMIITEHEEGECPHHKAERATQTDTKTEADISTQTGDDDETVVVMELATTEEDALNESVVVIAEEAVEETANEEASDNQTAGIISEDVVVTENNVYENIMFRAEWVEVTDNFEISLCNPEEESINGPEETEEEIPTEKEMVAEQNKSEETEPLEVSSSLPKVVADCVEAVFAGDSESTDVNMSEPSIDEVITEDNGEGAGDMSADVVLIETTEPELNVVTSEAREENGVPSLDKESGERNGVASLDEESVTMVIETISEISHEEPNPIPANQDTSADEHPALPETEIIIEEHSAHEEVTTDDAAAAGDVPEISEQDELSPVIDEPSEKCDSCPEEEIIIVEVSFNELIITDEFPEESADGEVEPESIPEVTTTDETAEIGENFLSDTGPETVEESDSSPAIVNEGDEVIPEAAIDVLSQEFEPSATTPEEPAADNGNPLEEEVIAATIFLPLSGEEEVSLAVLDEPMEETIIQTKDEAVAEEMNEEAIEALSNEFEAVSESVEEDAAVQESSTEGEVMEVEVSEDPVEDSNMTEETTETVTIPEESLLIAEETESAAEVTEVAISEEPVENSGMAEEKTEASEDVLTETVTTETPEESPLITSAAEVTEVTILEEPVEGSDTSEEKTEVSEDVLAETITTETPDEIPEEPEENPSPCEQVTITEVLEYTLESVIEAFSEKFEVIENTEEPEDEQVDVPPMEATEESEPSVQEEENVSQAEALVEDPDKDAPLVVEVEVLESIEPIDTNPEEPLEESEQQPQSEVIVVIIETTEEEATENIMQETVEENSEAETLECVEAVFETIVEEIIAEEVECNLVTQEVGPEVTAEEKTKERAENESSVDTTDSTMDTTDSQNAETSEDSSVTSTDMQALLDRLRSSCTSVVEESEYSLGGFEISSSGYSITITIHVDPKTEQQ